MRTTKQPDSQKPLAVKDEHDDERAFRIFLISSFVALALLAVLGAS